MNHLTGRFRFLLFSLFTIVIAAPPLTLKAPPPESSSSSNKNTGLNLSQTAAYDALLNFFPSSSPTKLPLSSVTNTSANDHFPPDPYYLITEGGDFIQFGIYNSSSRLLDLQIIVSLARDDAIRHLNKATPGPMPPELKYQHGFAFFDFEIEPKLTWLRWGLVLRQIGNFQALAGIMSFNFRIFTAGFGEQLGWGQVRAYE